MSALAPVVTVGRTAILGVEDVVGITALGVRSAAFMLVNTLALLLTMCDMVRLTKEAKEVGFPASLPPFFMVGTVASKGLQTMSTANRLLRRFFDSPTTRE
jgi:hypothetical protein